MAEPLCSILVVDTPHPRYENATSDTAVYSVDVLSPASGSAVRALSLVQTAGAPPIRRALTRTTTNFKDRQVLRRQHLPVPLCTFRGTHVPNHANVRVVDLHSLPRMFGPLHILLMHHDFLNEQPQQFRRQFLDVGVAPGF